MSVHALKPNFTDRETYLAWRASWKTVYSYISHEIRRRKLEVKAAQRSGDSKAPRMQANLILQRADAHKMLTLLDEAKLRRDRIAEMRKSIADQVASFPLTIEARVADFHFNKVAVEFSFMPKWVMKANGRTFYIEHLDAQMGFSTRELEKGSTLGMLRFRNCSITLDGSNTATLTPKANKLELAA